MKYKFILIVIFIFILIVALRLMLKSVSHKNDIEKMETLVPEMYAKRTKTISDARIGGLIDGFYESRKQNSNLVWEYDWGGADSGQFTDMLNTFEPIVISVCQPNSEFYKNDKAWTFIENFIDMVRTKIRTGIKLNQRVPFGNNWYSFSITWPRILCAINFFYHKVYNKYNEYFNTIMKTMVNYLIPTPRKSMGWTRNGSNAVMMLTPYAICHVLIGDWDQVKNTEDVLETLKDVELSLSVSGNGLYHDGSFLFHNTPLRNVPGGEGYLRAYGYLTSAFTEYVFLNRFLDMTGHTNTPIAINKILHPTIPLHFPSWFARTGKMTHDTSQFAGKLGMHTIDTIKGISVLAPTFALQFNGQSSILSYSEVDIKNSTFPLISIFMRRRLFNNTDPLILPKYVPYYPGIVSHNLTPIVYPVESTDSRMVTTQQYFPTRVKCALAKIGLDSGFYPNELSNKNIKDERLSVIGMVNSFYLDKEGIEVFEACLVTAMSMTSYLELDDISGRTRSVGFGKNIEKISEHEYVIDGREHVKITHGNNIRVMDMLDVVDTNNNNDSSDNPDEPPPPPDLDYQIDYDDDDDEDGGGGGGADSSAITYQAIICDFDIDSRAVGFVSTYINSLEEAKLVGFSSIKTGRNNNDISISNLDVAMQWKDGWLSVTNKHQMAFATTNETPVKYLSLPLSIFSKHKNTGPFLTKMTKKIVFSNEDTDPNVKGSHLDILTNKLIAYVNYHRLYFTVDL